ncbi:hypothetical protein P153DRAFT_414887 [Dothidotthia symphoricarpi CBS 119687]|uniref:RING-type domain-containing protein n=1 Tax=Dothidotthia symphoricarpi CBS 119687 TaxID=1392245 RepID=A0A6A6AR20_9PLEO|nr:uncharacterized protein P153DRAFT_414887 [Dothidotthia symphoricarpi CBS 119687]KAF2132951.1 hypothetical protein P153DRAFT_414887 [Dothidotthia symphoricarpi CBS 119687]
MLRFFGQLMNPRVRRLRPSPSPDPSSSPEPSTPPNKDEFIENIEPLTCSLCLEEYDDTHVPIQLADCGHIFGDHCIVEWFETKIRNNNRCPMCREKLFQQEDFDRYGNPIPHENEDDEEDDEGENVDDTGDEDEDEDDDDDEEEEEEEEEEAESEEEQSEEEAEDVESPAKLNGNYSSSTEDSDVDMASGSEGSVSDFQPDDGPESDDEMDRNGGPRMRPEELRGFANNRTVVCELLPQNTNP